MYYIFLESENLNGCGQCKRLDCENVEVEQEIYEDYIKTPNKYTWEEKEIEVPIYETQEVELVDFDEDENEIGTHFETEQVITGYENKTVKVIVLNHNYEKEEEEKEKERIKSLTCTKRVFALMLQELGISYKQLKELIESNEQAQLEWELCVELLRGNPLLDLMAMQFGITSEQLDRLFQYANGEITLEEFKKGE